MHVVCPRFVCTKRGFLVKVFVKNIFLRLVCMIILSRDKLYRLTAMSHGIVI